MIKFLSTASAAALLMAPAVFAGGYVAPVVEAEPVVAVTPVVSVADWSGAYVGANLNYGKGKMKPSDTYLNKMEELGLGRTLPKPEGVSGAVRAGYDWQVGQGVFGLGAEYNVGKYDGTAGDDPAINVEVKKAATLFARAGYAVNENLLAYGLLGYTWADAESKIEGRPDLKTDLDGVTVGLGGEYRFNPNWSGYAEYAYTDFGKVERTEGQLKASMQQVKLGVNYRF